MASARAVAVRNQIVAAAFVSSVVVVLGFWFTGFASPDRLLERSYARVAPHGTIYLDDMGPASQPALQVTTAAATVPASHPALLVNGVPVESGILSGPLAVGAHLRLAPGAHDQRSVKVVKVSDLDAPVVGIPGVRLQLVTARSLDHSAPDMVQLVFAIRDVDAGKVIPAVGTPAQGKVL